MPIKLLDELTVSRIAAGEVVERPASVVKELVENALDAGASRIEVETEGAGTGLIRVSDDGAGIPSDELELAFTRHATSKISGIGDLDSIRSLGFRGEALPSIASVAGVEVVTSPEGAASGSYIRMQDGRKEGDGSRGRSQGTTVTVRNLLRNVPARLKFLKSNATENGHIATVVTQYALACPSVRFSLSIDGRSALRTSGSGRLLDAVAEVYGMETASKMVELGVSDPDWQGGPEGSGVKVSGMVGSPDLSRANRNALSFFVNDRWITSRLLTWAVEEAYHGMMMTGRHPVAVIFIELPADEVDVNIHPTKTEVKFRDERRVFGAVQRSVRRALVEESSVPSVGQVSAPYHAPPRPSAGQPLWNVPIQAPVGWPPFDQKAATPQDTLPALRLIGQAASSYIIAEGPDGLYLIDQHAAHERIVFEKVRREAGERAVEVQGLLEPVPLELSPAQDEALRDKCTEFGEYGFRVEPFGDRVYLVRAVPLLLGQDWQGALRELLDALSEGKSADWREEVLITFACHGAVRAGKSLTDDEMREMLRQLEATDTPHTCPHGRPTIIRMPVSQLEREFRRT